MSKYWNEHIQKNWIEDRIDEDAVIWAEKFGRHLAKKDDLAYEDSKMLRVKIKYGKNANRNPLTTTQLRKFFGEVKRQQALGFNENDKTDFILLKPKLAYAVARSKDEDAKIHDFYWVISNAIDLVKTKDQFRNFIKIFEAIVAYHKANEESNLDLNQKS
jgi:CRISPR-associated protein Csm2